MFQFAKDLGLTAAIRGDFYDDLSAPQCRFRCQKYPPKRPAANLSNQIELKKSAASLRPKQAFLQELQIGILGEQAVDFDEQVERPFQRRKTPCERLGIDCLTRPLSLLVLGVGQIENDGPVSPQLGTASQLAVHVRPLTLPPALLIASTTRPASRSPRSSPSMTVEPSRLVEISGVISWLFAAVS